MRHALRDNPLDSGYSTLAAQVQKGLAQVEKRH
jgi:hypothetical protein